MPELVEDGISGLVVEDTQEALADATLQLLRRPEVRIAMGKAAWQKARSDFRLDKQAGEVEAFYERMLTVGKWNAGRG
jgi:glycosyltransferase involved in cell wall biosynthesis